MKTKIKLALITLMITFLHSYSYSQNGGNSAENESLRAELGGTTIDYQAIIIVTNKQCCTSTVKFYHNGNTREKTISALCSDTFRITLPECSIKVKPRTNCGGANMGWVELNVCQALPMRFEYIKTKQISKTEILVEFKPLEIDGKFFYIQFSKDGLNFQRVQVILPENIQVGKVYSTKIKIN